MACPRFLPASDSGNSVPFDSRGHSHVHTCRTLRTLRTLRNGALYSYRGLGNSVPFDSRGHSHARTSRTLRTLGNSLEPIEAEDAA